MSSPSPPSAGMSSGTGAVAAASSASVAASARHSPVGRGRSGSNSSTASSNPGSGIGGRHGSGSSRASLGGIAAAAVAAGEAAGGPGSQSRLGLSSGWGRINSIRFNQTGSIFVAGMDDGFRVYQTDLLTEMLHHDIPTTGAIGLAEIWYEYDYLITTSQPVTGKFSENSAMIWDNINKKFRFEYRFLSRVLNVLLNDNRAVFVLQDRVIVFTFPPQKISEVKKLVSQRTIDNPKGLCALAPFDSPADEDPFTPLAFPGTEVGQLMIVDMSKTTDMASVTPRTIKAHDTALSAIAISQQGRYVATASQKGTLVRIWDPRSLCPITELRRGTDSAVIYSMAFSPKADFFVVASDRGTVHIFGLLDYSRLNRACAFPGRTVGSYRSFASFKVPQEVECAVSFGKFLPSDTVYVVCMDGSYFKYHFDRQTGETTQQQFDDIMLICDRCGFRSMLRKRFPEHRVEEIIDGLKRSAL